MNDEVRNKLQKVQALINEGATEGEKEAARNGLDRIIKKHKISVAELASIDKKVYYFKYSTDLELRLLSAIIIFLVGGIENCYKKMWDKNKRGEIVKVKEVTASLLYVDYISIMSAYEYFRRHMKVQYKLHTADEVNTLLKRKKNKSAAKLKAIFISTYIIKSKLYREGDLVTVKNLKGEELKHRLMMLGVEGGQYKIQVDSGRYLQ